MKPLKLNVLLAKTDHLASSYKKNLEDYIRFFKSNQGAFKGEKKTYEPYPGTVDIPSERGNKKVITTVDEKLKWLEETSKEYINALFSQERTNSSGTCKAELIVEGVSFGEFTSLELLKLKSLLETQNFVAMYESIPVRTEDENWTKTSSDDYVGKDVFETDKMEGERKTTEKESYVMVDPNASSAPERYVPQVAHRDIVKPLGKYSFQRYSGEWSHRQRAELLRRRTTLVTAVIEALKKANETEVIKSEIDSDKIFNYLHRGVV